MCVFTHACMYACAYGHGCTRVHMCVCGRECTHVGVCQKLQKGKRYKIYWCVLSEFPILFFFFFESSEFPIH